MKAISPVALLIASVILSSGLSVAFLIRTETGLECARDSRSVQVVSHFVCMPEK
jgi:hypothetical protein